MSELSQLTDAELKTELARRERERQDAYMARYKLEQEMREAERHAALAAKVRLVLPEVSDAQLARLKDIFWDWAMEEQG